jgi:hypothetical protein
MSLTQRPRRERWTLERLQNELATLTGAAIEPSTAAAYTSATHSYATFCKVHQLPLDPTPLNLAYFVTYMSHYINPRSVETYLSGICSSLEPSFPHARTSRKHPLVVKVLKGAKKLHSTPISRKKPLSRTDLSLVCQRHPQPWSHDHLLFLSLLLTGFHGLLRLGELVWPDKRSLQDYRKIILRPSVEILPTAYSFFLPGHKADRFFEGNQVIVQQTFTNDDPFSIFTAYLHSRDALWPYNPELWLRKDGTIPTRSWFLLRLRRHFNADIAGHSLRSGGATALAEAGIPLQLIQSIGRWASETFQIYIRRHPTILASLITK